MLEVLGFSQKGGGATPVVKPLVGFNFDKGVSTGSTPISVTNQAGRIVTPPTPLPGYTNAFNLTAVTSAITPVTAFDIGTQNFTFEMAVYITQSAPGYNGLFFQSNSAGNNGIYISIADGGAYTNRLRFSVGGTTGPFYTAPITRSQMLNSWHHIALVRSGNLCYVYIDGKRTNLALGTATTYDKSAIPMAGSLGSSSNALSLGYTPSNFYVGGYVPEFELFADIKYTGDFTPNYPLYIGGFPMTYPQFLSWLSDKGIESLSNTAQVSDMAGKYTQCALDTTASLRMWGSSYGSHMTYDSLIHTVMLHACPTQSVADEIRANSRVSLFLTKSLQTYPSYTGITRNGYTSNNYYNQFQGSELVDFVYYDSSRGIMMRYNPSIMDIPTFFDGSLQS